MPVLFHLNIDITAWVFSMIILINFNAISLFRYLLINGNLKYFYSEGAFTAALLNLVNFLWMMLYGLWISWRFFSLRVRSTGLWLFWQSRSSGKHTKNANETRLGKYFWHIFIPYVPKTHPNKNVSRSDQDKIFLD